MENVEDKSKQYVYTLTLDEDAAQNLAKMIAPEIVNQVVSLTEGNVYFTIINDAIASIEVDINGTVTVLFLEVDASIGAVFHFE